MRFVERLRAQIRALAGTVKAPFKYGEFSSLNDTGNQPEDG